MRTSAKALTTVALIRSVPSRQAARENPLPDRPSPAGSVGERPGPGLAERWQAPVMTEEEIEAWATRYRLCPKTGMSFLEYLIARGVGSLD